jgi:hypothetical protein
MLHVATQCGGQIKILRRGVVCGQREHAVYEQQEMLVWQDRSNTSSCLDLPTVVQSPRAHQHTTFSQSNCKITAVLQLMRLQA